MAMGAGWTTDVDGDRGLWPDVFAKRAEPARSPSIGGVCPSGSRADGDAENTCGDRFLGTSAMNIDVTGSYINSTVRIRGRSGGFILHELNYIDELHGRSDAIKLGHPINQLLRKECL